MSENAGDVTGVSREILDLLERSRTLRPGGLWLNPAAVARNIGRSNNYINTKLRELYQEGYVESDGDGYYRISEQGTNAIRDL